MSEPETIRKVNVIGHLHPDTDSICSAISYAYLKNQLGDTYYEARRAGAVNRETAFVLDHFGFEEPPLITSVRPQIKDISYQKVPGIDSEMSLFAAWNTMGTGKVDTLCITDDEKKMLGIIAVKDIANANMDIFDTLVVSNAKTKYANIVETLKGELVLGDPEGEVTRGNVRVGTSPEMMEGLIEPGDIVLVTNRYETQRFAVESGVSCVIVCNGAHVSHVVVNEAQKRNCTVIATPYDTYAAARLISMAMPVRAKMLPADKVIHFSVNTTIDDARKVMTQSRHRFFPVVDEGGHYAGVVNGPNLLDPQKKHVILVDHNERSQAVDGLEQAVIMEIIDHHRIGSLETSGPVYFRNQPVGCTATIITQMYDEHGVEIPAQTAGLLLAAILSDTLVFRSPTCTPVDVAAAKRLAQIAGVDIDEFSTEMFEAGEKLDGKTPEEVFLQDFKVFMCGDIRFGVAQGSYMTRKNLLAAEKLLKPYLEEARNKQNVEDIYMLLTDVPKEESVVICEGRYAAEVLSDGFETQPAEDGSWTLPGVVSRKKQFIPAMMSAYQKL